MPTFPQHRNMKKAAAQKENREQEPTVTDQTNNLPAISDLVRVYQSINKSVHMILKFIFFQYISFILCIYMFMCFSLDR